VTQRKRSVRKRAPRRKPAQRPRAAKLRAAKPATSDPFRHVVVLMLENRSFDHMLGALQSELPALDGIAPGKPPRTNPGPGGAVVAQRDGAGRRIDPDPMHEKKNVLAQLAGGNAGFVKDYARAYPDASAAQQQEVMAYHGAGALAALHPLARSFAVFDRWFCSVPGPTWPNRLFAMSGTSRGRVEMPKGVFRPNLHRYAQPSLFRRVERARRRCGIYVGDFPLALLLADRRTIRGARSFHRYSSFAEHCEDEAEFPDLAWIEPSYLGDDANDDHPPHDILRGQGLVAEVYRAIRSNDSLFRSTLLVISYDEHGGFYDHVSPPVASPPDEHRDEYTFDRCGVRVPALLVSPWIPPQVVSTEVDHTALLRSLQLRWGLGDLGRRVAGAPDLLSLLTLTSSPRIDTPSLPAPRAKAVRAAVRRARAAQKLSDNEEAILAFSAWLDLETPGPPARKLQATRKAMRAPTDSRAVAKARAEAFLRHRGADL